MSTKPTDDISWATDVNYPVTGAPYDSTPTKADPGGLRATGWKPNTKPPAQNMNWWQWAVYTIVSWISALFSSTGHLTELDTYFDSNNHLIESLTRTRHIPPMVLWGSNYSTTDQLVAGDSHANVATVSTANGAWIIDLEVPGGYRLKQVIVRATGASGTGLTLSVVAPPAATGPEVTIHSLTGPTVGPTDVTFNTYGSMVAGTSVVVGGSAGTTTYTRTVGSWVTDGFEVGQRLDISGFVNAHNNSAGWASPAQVGGVTATVLTVQSDLSLPPVVETSVAGVIATKSSANDSTQYVALLVNSVGSNGAGTRAIRCTYGKV